MQLKTSDVYDFYGLTMLSGPNYAQYQEKRHEYLLDIKRKYVHALKNRIKAEAGYIDLDVDGDSIAAIVAKVSDHLNEAIEAEAKKMLHTGVGFSVMNFVKKFHDQKPKGLEAAPAAFRSADGTKRSMFGGEPWAKISEAFLEIEKAKTDKEIILSIDALNSLQHNTNYVLVDIAGVPGVAQIQAVMEEKFHSGPQELSPKMSKEVRKLLSEAGIIY